jgi:eukaryotic-like serine/threonine-protein kinase
MVPIDGSATPVAIVQPPSSQSNIFFYRIPPDGHWLAYVSDESGQVELYLTMFPEGKGKWPVSTNGAAYPSWSGNGKELFYETQANDFFVCPIATKGAEVVIGTLQRLFHTNSPGIGVAFDVFSDGKHLLVNRSEEEAHTPLRLVTNWLVELKK